MKTKISILISILCCNAALAQTPAPAPGGERITRIFPVKYANIKDLTTLLSIFGATLSRDEHMGVIAAQGSPATLSALEEAIKRLDVPPAPAQNAEITIYMIKASQSGSGGSVPKELDPAIKQLRNLFPYQDYRLLDTVVARARDGRSAEVNGLLPLQFDGMPGSYQLRIREVGMSPEGKERTIRFLFQFDCKIPFRPASSAQVQFNNVGLSTDVDLREGQKVVVGKSNIDGSKDALILVVTGKLVT